MPSFPPPYLPSPPPFLGVQGSPMVEGPTCTYTAYTRSSAACGSKGDPFSPQTFGPGSNFGFTVLGAVLLVFLQVRGILFMSAMLEEGGGMVMTVF